MGVRGFSKCPDTDEYVAGPSDVATPGNSFVVLAKRFLEVGTIVTPKSTIYGISEFDVTRTYPCVYLLNYIFLSTRTW